MTVLRLGAHMSIAGGLPRAVERAVAVEATALQVFVKSANQWRARPFAPGEVEEFRALSRQAGLESHTLAHATYLINLASPDDMLWERSAAAFVEEMARCAALGIPYLVFHPGSPLASGTEAGLARLTAAMDAVLSEPAGRGVTVLVEITAGTGSHLGATFEEVATILERSRHGERLGVCFDTCHALAAGYEFRDRRSYEETLAHFDAVIGLERLRAFHLNDSTGGIGCRRDRHAHIGRGEVGLEAFRLILNDPRFATLPMVIETEKQEDLEDDRVNLGILRSLVGR